MAILIVAPTRTSIELVVNVAKSMPGRKFYLHCDYITLHGKEKLRTQKNIKVLNNIFEISPIISSCEALLTFGCASHNQHRLSILFSLVFKSLGKPRFDMQHGLLQAGITLFDVEALASEEQIITDKILKWEDFGVPLSRKQGRFSGNNILVASNLHWSLYSDQDRSLFKRCVITMARHYPEYKFLWRLHPAEFFSGAELTPKLPLGYPECENIRYLSFDEIDKTSIEYNILDSIMVFTSPSTVIIDAERVGIPSLIFGARALRNHLAGFKRAEIVRTPEDSLSAAAGIVSGRRDGLVETGLEFGFAADRFEALLKQKSGALQLRLGEEPAPEDVLSLLLRTAALLGVNPNG